ncbi:hypothetical protein [Ahniella affigens]|uniref:hypothetical protein n=1 Tax=Ahniella affigens TaxID=2021234 RepID=UPI0011B1EF85|nr:hypothetical protein [Ahniella affigens]
MAERALEAYEIGTRCEDTGSISVEELARLEGFCADRSSMLRDWATQVVGALGRIIPAAAELLQKLAGHGRAEVGISAVGALHFSDNLELFASVVSSGLRHKSHKVRILAACKIQTFGMRNLVGQLQDAIGRETNAEARGSLESSLRLLLDGYLVKQLENGEVYVTVSVGKAFRSQLFSPEEFRQLGIEAIQESLRLGANV